jgi:trehalose 6-phosphate synthase
MGALGMRLKVAWAVRRMASRLQRVRQGSNPDGDRLPEAGIWGPLTQQVNRILIDLRDVRAALEEEAKLRLENATHWTPQRLRHHVRSVLQGRPLLVIANREPYTHIWQNGQIQCITPASGLVTAVEPILRACGGTWIASASGDADKQTADAHGRLRVPPDDPAYVLRRIWLSPQEELGYYYGFANEGLWPLCHLAYTRPLFRLEDWQQYRIVNERFAEAAAEEMAGSTDPFVLIQDYHYALLARLIKQRRPDARIALFWHIPWPNPEAFAICPWAKEILDGMLGADLIGFHIQAHCNNFLDTVDRLLECRIDWEHFAVVRGGHRTGVSPFPIGIATPPPSPEGLSGQLHQQARQTVMKRLGMEVKWLGVGVDRIDYTKGIPERFRAIERFLTKYPQFKGAFTFVELAAPSRTLIKRYSDLGEELEREAQAINRRFQTQDWKPIVFRKEHHDRNEVDLYYHAADMCLVTSLHDGMNLVGKEFVWARSDLSGVLILSRFAGASRQLKDAILVNPYDIEEMAEAIHRAATMPAWEQKERMGRMRAVLEEHNVYRWAADITTELNRVHPEEARV